MPLVVAIPFGVASAAVYGTSIVVQHRAAQQHAGDTGSASAAGLLRLVRNPAWLLAIVGDFVGFLLQLVALSTGPVVVIQPLVVLMLPVSLLVSSWLGWHKPKPRDYWGVVLVIAGLAVFLGLIGHPGHGRETHTRVLAMTIALSLFIGFILCFAATGRNRVIRGAMYGAVAGAFFGTIAVMINAASRTLHHHGVHGVVLSGRGLVPIAGMILVGCAGIVLTQMSFQIGTLAATLPANLAVDPLVAVVLGAVVLHERLPISTLHIIVYVLCLIAVVIGAIQLAEAEAEVEAGAEAGTAEAGTADPTA